MHSKLDQLKKMSVVVADSGDINAIKTFSPQDCTTNPSLILKAAQQEEYASLVGKVLRSIATMQGNFSAKLEMAVDKLAVAFGRELTEIVPGVVSTEVDAHLSFDTQAMINKARHLVQLYAACGVAKERILIKLAATWEGIKAAEVLEREGIRCNMTLIFCLEQAMACARAGAYLVSPFVGRITDWYKKAQGVEHFPAEEDPGVLSVRAIYQQFKKHGFPTVVMGASFRNTAQIEALAGCDRLTISPALLSELQNQIGNVVRQLSPDVAANGEQADLPASEQSFRWALNQNAMATEKLAEGIRLFHQDYVKLVDFIQAFATIRKIAL
jgi:transaldolase